MAKAQRKGGQYRQMLLEQRGQIRAEEEEPVSHLRIRFYLCLCLFVAYVILDYTKASVGSVDSRRIYTEISKDVTSEWNLQETFAAMINSITKEIYIQ